MTTATAWSTHPDARHAFNEAWSDLVKRLKGEPTLLLVYFTEQYSPADLLGAIAQLPPHIKVHGSTSCKGVMTEEGFHSKDGRGLGLFGISDAGGDYGVGAASQKGDARKAGAEALINALADAGRPGEVPDLIWLSTPPGHEEELLKGIVDIVGAYVPVIGGTAADNAVTGRWRIVTRNSAQQDAVLVSVLFPTFKVSYSFQSGYFPTSTIGTITSASGRIIHTIDHQPAGEIYKKWTARRIHPFPHYVGAGWQNRRLCWRHRLLLAVSPPHYFGRRFTTPIHRSKGRRTTALDVGIGRKLDFTCRPGNRISHRTERSGP
jgi:hypothetical protein